jgi:hypothetical protein
LFNPRWKKGYSSAMRASAVVDMAFGANVASINETARTSSDVPLTEDQRIAELAAMSKQVILRSVGASDVYKMIRAAYVSLLETVKSTENTRQKTPNETGVHIRNPLKVRTKGRPKTGGKRYISVAEKQQSKQKKSK